MKLGRSQGLRVALRGRWCRVRKTRCDSEAVHRSWSKRASNSPSKTRTASEAGKWLSHCFPNALLIDRRRAQGGVERLRWRVGEANTMGDAVMTETPPKPFSRGPALGEPETQVNKNLRS